MSLVDITTTIKSKKILKNINCNFPRSKISVIIGRSGAGKSTLLKTIAQFWTYTGKIIYQKEDIKKTDVDILRRNLSYVGQIPVAFEGTVKENIEFPRKFHQMDVNDDITDDLIKLVGLDLSLKDQDAKTLSVGQKQRLHLARTLANEPHTLLLDEPASALDVISKNKFEEMILSLKSANPELTILIVTHDLNQARAIGDYLVLIENGKVILAEESDQFFSQTLVGKTDDKDGKLLQKLIEKLTGESI
ncbi:MAG: putative osmoprotectant uptake system ATP-binding protein YehX [Candidatus Heimdallarchaeota archaeon LC_2]|nr:MAG: putative osmoprotectant uptake system ATP-binding protein YehX [Candidatus Heimdallarchaeota archaeon LC_2]